VAKQIDVRECKKGLSQVQLDQVERRFVNCFVRVFRFRFEHFVHAVYQIAQILRDLNVQKGDTQRALSE